MPKPPPRECQQNAWIYNKTWRLADMQVIVLRWPHRDQRLVQELVQNVREILQADRKPRTETAGA